MTRDFADRLGRLTVDKGNLAAYLAVMEPSVLTIPYEKQERHHGSSRVGAVALGVEAVASLAATGGLARLSALLSLTLLGTGLAGPLVWGGGRLCSAAILGLAGAFALVAVGAARWRKRVAESLDQEPSDHAN